MNEKIKSIMIKWVEEHAKKINGRKLVKKYYEKTRNEQIKVGKNYTNNNNKELVSMMLELRGSLFPCKQNFWHVKRTNKKCRWCEKSDKIEDENHIFTECEKSPLKEFNFDVENLIFGSDFELCERRKMLLKKCLMYKNILSSRGEKI